MNVVVLQNENIPNILGARHQSNHAFLFDVENNQVSFNPFHILVFSAVTTTTCL